MAYNNQKTALQVNQLQFIQNPAGGATVPQGLPYSRQHKPQPIVIHKLGGSEAGQRDLQVGVLGSAFVFTWLGTHMTVNQ